MKRRAVITGIAGITAIGSGIDTMWDSMIIGKTGIDKIEKFDPSSYICKFGGLIKGFSSRDISISGKNLMNYTNQLEMFSVIQALTDYNLTDDDNSVKTDCAVFLGNQLINMDTETLEIMLKISSQNGLIDFTLLGENLKQLPPLNGVKLLPTVPSHFIAKTYNIHGEGSLQYSGETSSLLNILRATNEIENGYFDRIIVSSVFSPFSEHEFLWLSEQGLMRHTSFDDDPQELMFPFDKRHRGIIYGEGAGTLIIESEELARKNGKKILAYINGGAANTFPGETFYSLTKEGFKRNIMQTLNYAGLKKEDINLIFSNAPSHPEWDNPELQAIVDIWENEKIGISNSKAYTGYLGCSSGIVDCIFAIMSMSKQQYLPVPNFESADEQVQSNLNEFAKKHEVSSFNRCLINNAGSGGSYCSIVVEKGEEA